MVRYLKPQTSKVMPMDKMTLILSYRNSLLLTGILSNFTHLYISIAAVLLSYLGAQKQLSQACKKPSIMFDKLIKTSQFYTHWTASNPFHSNTVITQTVPWIKENVITNLFFNSCIDQFWKSFLKYNILLPNDCLLQIWRNFIWWNLFKSFMEYWTSYKMTRDRKMSHVTENFPSDSINNDQSRYSSIGNIPDFVSAPQFLFLSV